MKTRHLLLSVLAVVALASACQQEENLGMPELTVNPTELRFGVEAGSQTFTLKATRDWVVENIPEWIALDPQRGQASLKDQTVTVTVMPNSGVNRTADLRVTIGLLRKTLKVSQKGEAGSEEDALLYFNDFDKEAGPTASPFPYCDATEIWKNQTGKGVASVEYVTSKASVRGNSPSNTHNSENYIGSGVNNILFGENGFLAVKKLALNGATNLIMTFGTERYLYGAEDNTFKHDEFLVSASIDGEHFANLEYTFATGDLSGTWDLAKTEFAVPAGTEYLYLHFTSTIASGHRLDDLKVLRGGNGTVPDYAGGKYIDISGGNSGGDNTDYENAPASTVADFIKSDGKTVYKLTGKVSDFKKGTNSSGKNWMQFNLTDATGTILVYGFKDGQYDAWNSKITDGGTIVVGGTYEYYSSKSQHEVMNAMVLSFEGGEPQTDITPKTVSEFIKTDGTTYYQLTGTVSEFKTGTASSGKNWMQFNLTDATGTILVYGFKDGQYEAWSSKISDGGTVVVTGTYEYYSSKSQHEVMNATVISFTSGSTPPPTPVDGENLDVIIGKKVVGQSIDVQTNEVFVGAATTRGVVVTDGTNHIYVFTNATPSAKVGDKVTVRGKLEDYYGLPEITGTPTVTVVSSGATVPYPAPKDITSTIDSYSSSVAEYITIQAEAFQSGTYINYKVEGATRGVELSSAPSALTGSIKAGDKVTLTGYYNSLQSTRNNVLLILVKVEGGSGETPGGNTPGGDTPGGDTPAGDFASNVSFAAGTSSQLGKIKVNGGETEYDCLKMGTGSKTGQGTVTLPAGTSKVSFYAIGWTSTGTTLVAEIGSNKQEVAVAANASVSGNSPWNVTVSSSDYHTIDLGGPLAADTVVNVSTSNESAASNTRAIVFGIKAE